ncbi:MAG TPA: hypothetical protein VLI67_03365, partial [Vicinamibacteria bacterium]|nr:hypothetical protein [Vicinamibacteria bacterium]
MTHWKRAGSILAVAIGLAGTALLPQAAEAHGRGRGGFGGRGGAYFGGFYGFSPFFGYGFGPYWAPYWGPYAGPYFRPEGGVDMNAAMIAGFGAVDLDVKPGQAEVWVDGRYVGEARDLDGYPSYLWLEQGAHKLAIYKGGYLTF